MNNNQENLQIKRGLSRIPAAVCAFASLLLPGLGHILSGAFKRGSIYASCSAVIVGLSYWLLSGLQDVGSSGANLITRIWNVQPALLISSVVFVVFYCWIAADAYRLAATGKEKPRGPIVLIILIFLSIGWEVGDVDLYQLMQESSNAVPRMTQVLWPWERAVSQESREIVGEALIDVPCDDSPPVMVEVDEGNPFLLTEPACGNLSQQDGSPGTSLTLTGGGFIPGTDVQIWWMDPLGNRFRARVDGDYLLFLPDDEGAFEIEATLPYRLVPDSAPDDIGMTWSVLAVQTTEGGQFKVSDELIMAVKKMIETIFLGMMATAFGIVMAVPVSFLAARNLMSHSKVGMFIYYVVRTLLNGIRSVEPLIWAVIFVTVVGLGPFAGIVALTLHTIAALGKLYSEAIESIDPGPIEAIQATGANWIKTAMYGVIPQVIPAFISFTIYRWDINVRMSTVIGLVGGGGIGYLLVQWMRLLDFKAAGIAVWFIVITVAVLDMVSGEIRRRIV